MKKKKEGYVGNGGALFVVTLWFLLFWGTPDLWDYIYKFLIVAMNVTP